jgi:hypothetical protein
MPRLVRPVLHDRAARRAFERQLREVVADHRVFARLTPIRDRSVGGEIDLAH